MIKAGGRVDFLPNLFKAALNLAFPGRCAACQAPLSSEEPFCEQCISQITPLAEPCCPVCANPLPKGRRTCPHCQTWRPAFDQARALSPHDGPLAQALHNFKYSKHLWVGEKLAKYIHQKAPYDWLSQAQIIAPVPLHTLRLMKRGFNQALVLNSQVCKNLPGKLVPNLLKRTKNTTSQVKLDLNLRRKNVAHAFALKNQGKDLIADKTVLLLDDVLTTGSTAHECTKILKKAGAGKVLVFTFLRAV